MNFSSLLKELESASPVQKTEEMLVEELTDYQIVDDKQALEQLISRLLTEKEICIDTETTHIHPLRAKLVGVGVGVSAKQAWYIPTNGKLGLDVVLQSLKSLLENPEIGFYGHNLKYDYQVFLNYGIRIASICFDTILASYILNSHSRKHSLDHLTFELFNKIKIPIEAAPPVELGLAIVAVAGRGQAHQPEAEAVDQRAGQRQILDREPFAQVGLVGAEAHRVKSSGYK